MSEAPEITVNDLRIGHGYDAHRRVSELDLDVAGENSDHKHQNKHSNAKRCLVLGGVEFANEVPLVGHSDADVVCHAVIDALLSAAGLSDIGEMFPDSDPAFAGASGLDLLRRSTEATAKQGWSLVNADCTVVTDRPMIAPHKPQMQQLLSEAAGGQVTVSGKRTEGIGALGRGEGVVALAVALLVRKSTAKGQ